MMSSLREHWDGWERVMAGEGVAILVKLGIGEMLF